MTNWEIINCDKNLLCSSPTKGVLDFTVLAVKQEIKPKRVKDFLKIFRRKPALINNINSINGA